MLIHSVQLFSNANADCIDCAIVLPYSGYFLILIKFHCWAEFESMGGCGCRRIMQPLSNAYVSIQKLFAAENNSFSRFSQFRIRFLGFCFICNMGLKMSFPFDI